MIDFVKVKLNMWEINEQELYEKVGLHLDMRLSSGLGYPALTRPMKIINNDLQREKAERGK